jgi:alpha-tubulin suppressor-like RCC1 family protein
MTGRTLGLPSALRGTAHDRTRAGRSARSRTRRPRRSRTAVPLALILLAGALSMATAAPASANDVIAWGGNAHHQLGAGVVGNSDVPRLVCQPEPNACPGTHLENVIAVSAGGEHSLALLGSGEVVAWGRNTEGALGDGTTTTRAQPVYVCKVGAGGPCQTALDAGERLTGVIAISAGNGNSNIALLSNETVVTWGSNTGGQLGIGSSTPSYSAIPMRPCAVGSDNVTCVSGPYLEGIAAVSAAPAHDVAIRTSNREALSWGADKVGQLGRGDWYKTAPGINRALPVCRAQYSGDYVGFGPLAGENKPVSTCPGEPLTGVVSVSFGLQHNLALIDGFPPGRKGGKGEGEEEGAEEYDKREHEGKEGVHSVVSWGYNNDGQLGDHEPKGGPNHCWTTHLPCSEVPVPVCLVEFTGAEPCTGEDALQTASAVAAGGSHSLALVNGENVVSWGEALYGTLGNHTTAPNSYVPKYVCSNNGTGACSNLAGVTAISAGEFHNLALLGNGEVVSWGQNTDGQLGNGEEGVAAPETCSGDGCSNGPMHVCQVGGPGGLGCPTLTGAIEISAGRNHSLAVGEYPSALVWYKKNVELTKGAAHQAVATSGTLTLHTISGTIACKVKDSEEIWNPLSGVGEDEMTMFLLGSCKSGLCPKPQKTEVNALGLNWPSHLTPGPPVRDQIEKIELEIRCSGSGLLDKYKGTLTPEVGNGVLTFGAGSGELEDSGSHKANITGTDKLTAAPGKITAH